MLIQQHRKYLLQVDWASFSINIHFVGQFWRKWFTQFCECERKAIHFGVFRLTILRFQLATDILWEVPVFTWWPYRDRPATESTFLRNLVKDHRPSAKGNSTFLNGAAAGRRKTWRDLRLSSQWTPLHPVLFLVSIVHNDSNFEIYMDFTSPAPKRTGSKSEYQQTHPKIIIMLHFWRFPTCGRLEPLQLGFRAEPRGSRGGYQELQFINQGGAAND